MATDLIKQRVSLARDGRNPYVVCQMPSGWLVMGDLQPTKGYCLLLADPVVESLNHLGDADRIQFCRDMARVGDALVEVTGAYRINYEILGNQVPDLHAHITPRYLSEPTWLRRLPPGLAHPKMFASRFDTIAGQDFIARLRSALHAEDEN